MNLAQNLVQTKEKLCKVIPNYAENVNKTLSQKYCRIVVSAENTVKSCV